MADPSTPKIAPIKLKLSLGSKLATPAPTAAPTTPTLTLTTGKKRKEFPRDNDQNEGVPISTPSGDDGSKKKKGKSKVFISTPVSFTPVNEISLNEEDENQAGPSRITLPNPSSLLGHQTIPNESPIPPAPSTPTPSATRGRPSKSNTGTGSTTKKKTQTQSKSTPRTSKSNLSKGRRPIPKPSAIPSRLLSESISTPTRSSLPLAQVSSEQSSPFESPSNTNNSSEATSPDPLSLSNPLSPSAYNGEIPNVGTPHNGLGEDTQMQTPQSSTRGHRTGGKWMRIKRPLKELLNRTLAEMRRKDDYALFEEPVDLEAFPDYLDVIGGEDKMMDMGTMQRKVDSGEYTSVEQLEADLHLLVDAAQKFNPPGSIPYNSAARILTIGIKHVERSKPLVLTPSPSPTRESATPFGSRGRGYSVLSGREGTAALEDSLRRAEEIPPLSHIPEQMLDFPPNSLQALAVGWNLNGGKRVHAKRIVRSREKFSGKWRHWEIDGTRDIAEMDDPTSLLERWKVSGKDKLIDWKETRNAGVGTGTGQWWESDANLSGPSTVAGQPPIPYAPYNPRWDKVVEKEVGLEKWGNDNEITEEMKYRRRRMGMGNEIEDEEVLSEHLRPSKPRRANSRNDQLPPPPATMNLTNIYEDTNSKFGRNSIDWIGDITTGGSTQGEAYLNSVMRFVEGAMKGASTPGSPIGSKVNENEEEHKPVVENQTEQEDSIPLDEYVLEQWHDGILSKSKARSIYRQTIQDLSKPLHSRPEWIRKMTSDAYARIALREMTLPTNPLDIKPLLRLENDFLHQGVGARVGGSQGIKMGLEWIGGEIQRLDKEITEKERQKMANESDERKKQGNDGDVEMEEIADKQIKLEVQNPNGIEQSKSTVSSPLSSAPASPQPPAKPVNINPPSNNNTPTVIPTPSVDPGDTASLRILRLELVALAKFYPLPALKKMRDYEAAKLLPFNVRSLMIVPEDLKKVGNTNTTGSGGGKVKSGK
ncbi:hypothetical protein L486_06871 [Kwoniella mangroviensis CBS 10435]|uniref:Bromo domain-containing protein n=1 Tax=Kwoniella mangroviensis CBS 10435 TaxID=1331196 RepID=A0A1B9II87_9TREE|nr:hypothetical protein L486_06871 [Kwoniella mangroviensis CBS 10435]